MLSLWSLGINYMSKTLVEYIHILWDFCISELVPSSGGCGFQLSHGFRSLGSNLRLDGPPQVFYRVEVRISASWPVLGSWFYSCDGFSVVPPICSHQWMACQAQSEIRAQVGMAVQIIHNLVKISNKHPTIYCLLVEMQPGSSQSRNSINFGGMLVHLDRFGLFFFFEQPSAIIPAVWWWHTLQWGLFQKTKLSRSSWRWCWLNFALFFIWAFVNRKDFLCFFLDKPVSFAILQTEVYPLDLSERDTMRVDAFGFPWISLRTLVLVRWSSNNSLFFFLIWRFGLASQRYTVEQATPCILAISFTLFPIFFMVLASTTWSCCFAILGVLSFLNFVTGLFVIWHDFFVSFFFWNNLYSSLEGKFFFWMNLADLKTNIDANIQNLSELPRAS